MEPRAQRVLLILADISGYTRFMVASRLALVHGQQVITALIESILREVELPLEVQAIEGDAVFLYAVHPGDDAGWQDVCRQVRDKLPRFFEAFSAALVAESESTLCPCEVCHHLHELGLKIVVHSGEALFHRVGRFADLAGVDVILAHRLLKNSVPSHEYILMTEPAYRHVGLPEELPVTEHPEDVDGIGRVVTYVNLRSGGWERARDAFLARPLGEMLRITLGGGLREVRGQFRAWARPGPLLEAMPLPDVPTPRDPLSALILALMTPLQLLFFPPLSSGRALLRRLARRRHATPAA